MKINDKLLAKLKAAVYAIAAEHGTNTAIDELQNMIAELKKDQWR
jgi:hypothetical protein